MKNEVNMALVIKTNGLEYDDRVRKEVLSVQKLFPEVRFTIYVMLPDNKESSGFTEYGVPYKTIYIPARDKYKSAQKILLKAYQFYRAVKSELMSYDAIWVANEEVFFIPFLLHHKHILWDLHELPLSLLKNMPMRYLLRYTFNRCKVVLHANPQRIDYLYSKGVIGKRTINIALRNYPNFNDIDKDYDEIFQHFQCWKKGRKCVYLQGLTEDRRAAYESIAAVLRHNDLVAVVIGKMHVESMDRLRQEYGEATLSHRVHFVGRIPQLKIPQYVAESHLSLVFYKNVSPNNYYCEANRFYQSVILGLPVVVGNNPPMKEIVERNGFGVVIDDDGCNIDKISEGINDVIENYDYYKTNIDKNKHVLIWDSQEEVIRKIVLSLYS